MSRFAPCQFFNTLGEHRLGPRMGYHFRHNLGVRTHLRRQFRKYRVGASSIYAEGQWVQVLDKESIQRTLDADSKHRGLPFLPYQWIHCGEIYRVQKIIRSMLDDEGIFRPIARTVLLENVDCSSNPAGQGCGRGCPLMFRDEWLKPAAPATTVVPALNGLPGRYACVRSAQEIQATLDSKGKRDGLAFMPEMYRWTDRRFRVTRSIEKTFEFEKYVTPRGGVFILDGLYCSGAILGRAGLCERTCSVLWHKDWLTFENTPA